MISGKLQKLPIVYIFCDKRTLGLKVKIRMSPFVKKEKKLKTMQSKKHLQSKLKMFIWEHYYSSRAAKEELEEFQHAQ